MMQRRAFFRGFFSCVGALLGGRSAVEAFGRSRSEAITDVKLSWAADIQRHDFHWLISGWKLPEPYGVFREEKEIEKKKPQVSLSQGSIGGES